MINDLAKAKNILNSGNYTCVLSRHDSIYTSAERSVKPLVVWLECEENFKDFCAADKVVGKATAFLYVLLGVKSVYAHVIIINRQGDGICPFEAAVLDVTEPVTAYKTIRRKMSEM